jgi:diguanylate cyclase (GGDEF)-like protein/PAS domain S-box-containing protein
MDDDRRTTRAIPDGDTLRSFLDRGPIVAFIKDDGGHYVYVNPAMEQLFGVLASDVQGREAGGWMPEHLATIIREHDPQVLMMGLPLEMIASVPRPDGAARYWKIVRFPFADPGGTRFIGGVAVDVTDLQQAQAQLAESERRYRHLVENGQGLICTHDMQGRLLTVNQAALTLTGYTAEQMLGRDIRDVLSPISREVFSLYLERMEHVGSDDGMMYVQSAGGRELAWKYRNVRIDEPGKPSYVLGHAQDVTELREAEQHLRQLAMTDDLTGLLNRRGFLVNGSRILQDAVAHGKSAAVFYVDIDGLKAINDDHGHDAGSTLIVAAAEAMKNSFRAADVLARMGGDEFVALVIVPPDDVATITNRLRWHVDKFNAGSDLPYSLSMSIGVSRLDRTGIPTLEGLVNEADTAMYRHKRPGLASSTVERHADQQARP